MSFIKKEPIKDRKSRHFNYFAKQNREAGVGRTLLDELFLIPAPLKPVSMASIDSSLKFIGKIFDYPIMISSITGGMSEGKKFNSVLAQLAVKYNIPLVLGSIRAMIENPSLRDTFDVSAKTELPFLGANIGACQAVEYGAELLNRTLESLKCDALFIHLNKIQELAQENGDRDFLSLDKELKTFIGQMKYPVIIKETGSGMDFNTATKACELGAVALEVSGAGGTSFLQVEMNHMGESEKELWRPFLNWGVPTAPSIMETVLAGVPVIGSGGIRNGLDLAKVIVLGSKLGGIAAPFVEAWHRGGEEEMENFLKAIIKGLKISMMLTGARSLKELQEVEYTMGPELAGWFS
jgi:isopentenyl-diphosphate Delta-isomerase